MSNRLLMVLVFVMLAGVVPLASAAQVTSPAGAFIDDDGNPHEPSIEGIAAAGITRGCNPPIGDRYCPAGLLTRAEMAALLIRAMGEEENLPAYQGLFPDVPSSEWYAGPVERAAQLGVTTGYPDGTFQPFRVVSRSEMAALILRAIGEDDALPAFQGRFFDVPEGAWYTPYVERLAELGITFGCRSNSYCPDDPVRRDQMATFLVRAFEIDPITP